MGMIVRIGLALLAVVTVAGIALGLTLTRVHHNAHASGPLPPGPVNTTWYFAEGRVGGGAAESLALSNPDPVNTCSVKIRYFYQLDGGTSITSTVTVSIPPVTRLTESVNTDLSIAITQTPAASVAAIVTVNPTPTCNGIVAERPMQSNHNNIKSGSDVMGATHLGTTFYFPDVPNGGAFSSFFAVLNPPTGNAATVTVNYYANGALVGTQKKTIASGTRGTIFPSNLTGLPQRVAAVVTSTQPILVERSDSFSVLNAGVAGAVSGAATVVGSQTTANDWLFDEGNTGGKFQEYLIIANVDLTHAANVTINLEYKDGTTHSFPVTVNAESQLIWDVNANGVGGTTSAVSAEITSTGANIIAEREIFFKYSHLVNNFKVTASGGTEAIGQIGPAIATTYSFADGYTHNGYDEVLTLQNPTAATEVISVTLTDGYGRVYNTAFHVLAHARSTVDITAIVQLHMVQPGDDDRVYQVSMTVQTTVTGAVFLAERVTYWNSNLIGDPNPTQGATDVFGYTGG